MRTKRAVPFPCVICGKVFRSKDDLHLHSVFHEKDETNQCNICGSVFMSRYGLGMHLLTHNDKASSFACPQCSMMRRHVFPRGKEGRKDTKLPKTEPLELDPKFSKRLRVRLSRLDRDIVLFAAHSVVKRRASSESEDVEVVMPVSPERKVRLFNLIPDVFEEFCVDR